jgi:hypothetical protein
MSERRARSKERRFNFEVFQDARFRALMTRIIEADPMASRAVEHLLNAGCEPDILARWITLVSFARQLPLRTQQRATGRNQRSPWYSIPGIPAYKVKRFPNQLRRTADEIKQINCELFQIYSQNDGERRETMYKLAADELYRILGVDIQDLKQLPSLLLRYATFIDGVCKIVETQTRRAAEWGPKIEVDMLDWVQAQTGEPNYNAVSTLLNAAISLQQVKDHRFFTAASLKRSHTSPARGPKRHTQTDL